MNLKSSLGSPPSPFPSPLSSLPPSPSLKLGRELLEARRILRAESQAGTRVHVDPFKGVKLKQPKVCVQKIGQNKLKEICCYVVKQPELRNSGCAEIFDKVIQLNLRIVPQGQKSNINNQSVIKAMNLILRLSESRKTEWL